MSWPPWASRCNLSFEWFVLFVDLSLLALLLLLPAPGPSGFLHHQQKKHADKAQGRRGGQVCMRHAQGRRQVAAVACVSRAPRLGAHGDCLQWRFPTPCPFTSQWKTCRLALGSLVGATSRKRSWLHTSSLNRFTCRRRKIRSSKLNSRRWARTMSGGPVRCSFARVQCANAADQRRCTFAKTSRSALAAQRFGSSAKTCRTRARTRLTMHSAKACLRSALERSASSRRRAPDSTEWPRRRRARCSGSTAPCTWARRTCAGRRSTCSACAFWAPKCAACPVAPRR